MILINLLPHREAARKRQKELFQTNVFAAFLAGLLAASMVYSWFHVQISAQKGRNALLQSEITVLNQQIKEIEGLEGEITALRERQKAVEDLQANRNFPVHMLNELVRQIPEGIYITELRQNGMQVEMKGTAQSNQLVSEMLNNFSTRSLWFSQPNLREIVASNIALTPREQRKVVNFSLSFSLVSATQAYAQQNGQSAAAVR